MKKAGANLLLLVALVLPVALFLVLLPRGLLAPVVAVACGWALNVVWAYAAQASTVTDPADPNQNYVTIATRFGWACPAVLVLLAWLVWRFLLGHST